MGNCQYCGKPAGLLHSQHAECKKQHEKGKGDILTAIARTVAGSSASDGLLTRINSIAQSAYIADSEKRSLLTSGWGSAVDSFLADGVLDESEEKQLAKLMQELSLSQAELDSSGASAKVIEAAILRDVLNGIVPQRITLEGSLPFNLQRNEKIVWTFPNTDYLKDKIRRQYVGGSQGVSVRIMKGVYYHVGAFKAAPVDRTERVHVDSGLVGITNKHIYFAGTATSFRVPYAKIVSFQPFSDGVGLTRDASSAKPEIFVTKDGWFTYNLVTNLARI